MSKKSRTSKDPAMQGEGNYDAARRHRKSVEEFIESNDVEDAARDAAPDGDAEQTDLRRAEDEGKSHARK
jgi:hypothetical protein